MRALLTVVVALVLLVTPVSLHAWGMDVHRFLTKRAVEGLPDELKPFFTTKKDFMSEHAADPDLWRVLGLKSDRGEEDPNHFLDIDGLDEPRPFRGVPREWDAVVARYGVERANRMGRLPWRADDLYRLLVKTFQDVAKGTPSYAADNAAYVAAVLSHYIEDAHQPFHGTVNYDGQSTNQRGIHSRFESELVLRHLKVLDLKPIAIRPIANMRDFIFDRLVEDEAMLTTVLDADRAATKGREFYDDAYYAAFFRDTHAILERRLSEASSAVASAIVSAWIEAGKPAMPTGQPSGPVRIRR
jgi:alkylated DNA nucleotide flippase Atl1